MDGCGAVAVVVPLGDFDLSFLYSWFPALLLCSALGSEGGLSASCQRCKTAAHEMGFACPSSLLPPPFFFPP